MRSFCINLIVLCLISGLSNHLVLPAKGVNSIEKESITDPDDNRTWKYKWTQSGMLKTVIRPDSRKVDFTYDALGRRLSKTYQDQTTHFVWDGNIPLHEWTSSIDDSISHVNDKGEKELKTPENLTTWVFEDGTFIPMAKLQGEKSYSIITDHLGTPTDAFDEQGKKVWTRQLNIYGETRKETGFENFIPFLYQGQYLDSETKLAYNRYRYYSPESGTYVSQDPIRLEGKNINLYGYVFDVNSELDAFGLSKAPLNLSGGFSGRLDRFPMGDGVDFEIHVYNKGGVEVGIFGSEGFMNKHGLSGADVDVPDTVQNRLKGLAVKEMRGAGRIGPLGTENIKGDKWKRPRLTGKNC